MKKTLLIGWLFFCFTTGALSVESGATEDPGFEIFKNLGCGKCHNDEEQSQGPALHRVAGAYENVEALLLFFTGKTDSVLEPARAKTMIPRRRKIAKLDDAEKRALATYVMGFKK